MAKKQIKELIVKTSSPGAAQAAKELRTVVTAMEQAERHASEFTKQISQGSSSLSTIAKDIGAVSKAVDQMTSSLGKSTKSTEKGFGALMDNLELTTLYMRDLASESTKVSANLQGLGSHDSLEGLENAVKALLPLLEHMGLDLEEISLSSQQMANSSGETVLALDRLSDRIVEVEDAAIGGVRATKELGDVIGGVGERSKTSGVQVNKYTNDVRRLSGAGSQSARAFSDLAFKMNPLVSIYAKIAVNVYALTSAFRVLNNAANLQRLTEGTAKFSATITGVDVTYLSKQLQELSGNAISTGQALKLSVSGISFGFTTDQMERLTVATRKASVAMGVEFGDSLDRVISGIAKMEGQALNAVGVVTQVETAVKKWAAANNRTVSSMTDLERQTAFAEEALSQMEAKFGSFDAPTTGFEELGVAIKNLTDNTLILSGGLVDSYASRLSSIVRGLEGVRSAWDDVASAKEVYDQALISGNIAQARIAQEQHTKALERARKEQKAGTEENKAYIRSLEEAERAQKLMNNALAIGVVFLSVWASIKLAGFVMGVIALTAKLKVLGGVLVTIGGSTMAVVRPLILAAGLFASIAGVSLSSVVLVLAAIAAAVVALGVVAYKMIEPFQEFVDLWAGKFMNMVKSSLKWIKNAAASVWGFVRDGILSFTGLDTLTDKMTKVKGVTDESKSAFDEYTKTVSDLQGEIERYNLSLQTTDQLADRLLKKGDIFRKLGVPEQQPFSLYPDGTQHPEPQKGPMVEMSVAEAQEVIDYAGTLAASLINVSTAAEQMKYTKTPIDNFMDEMSKLAKVPSMIKHTPEEFSRMKSAFDELASSGRLPEWIEFDGGKGLIVARNLLKDFYDDFVHFNRFFESELEIFDLSLIQGDPTGALQSMTKQLNEQKRIYESMMTNTGPEILEQEKEGMKIAIDVLEAEKERVALTVAHNRLLAEAETTNAQTRLELEAQTELESRLLAFDVESLEAKIALGKEHKIYVGDLERELAILQRTLTIAERSEATERRRIQTRTALLRIENDIGRAGTLVEEVRLRQEALNLEKQLIDLMPESLSKEEELLKLKLAQAELDRQRSASVSKDASAVFASISGMQGLTQLQSTASSSLSSVMDVVGDFQSQMADSSQSFFDFLKGDIEAFGNVAKAGLDLAQSLFADSSKAKVDAIDREIAAEERRDGKSEESQAKIRALQAKKIKEEGKVQKASTMMSTASAIMQVMSQMPFPANLAVAAGYAAMGAMQMSQIDKAMNGQLAGLGGGTKSMSFSAGRPDNNVDVSKSASAGEYSHLNNFTPGRAVGNFAAAGTSIVVGESGPEEITPALPVNVSSAGREGSGSTIVFQPIFHNNTVDAAGMEELMQSYSRQLYDGLETELRARNKTLDNL